MNEWNFELSERPSNCCIMQELGQVYVAYHSKQVQLEHVK